MRKWWLDKRSKDQFNVMDAYPHQADDASAYDSWIGVVAVEDILPPLKESLGDLGTSSLTYHRITTIIKQLEKKSGGEDV